MVKHPKDIKEEYFKRNLTLLQKWLSILFIFIFTVIFTFIYTYIYPRYVRGMYIYFYFYFWSENHCSDKFYCLGGKVSLLYLCICCSGLQFNRKHRITYVRGGADSFGRTKVFDISLLFMYINRGRKRIEIYAHVSSELFLYKCLVLRYHAVQEKFISVRKQIRT